MQTLLKRKSRKQIENTSLASSFRGNPKICQHSICVVGVGNLVGKVDLQGALCT